MEFVALDIHGTQLSIRDYQALWVLSGVEFSTHRQAAARLGAGNQLDDDLETYQRAAAPVHGDE